MIQRALKMKEKTHLFPQFIRCFTATCRNGQAQGGKMGWNSVWNCIKIHLGFEVRSFKECAPCRYRHSLIYAVNVGTHKKKRGSKNPINRGYLVVLKGRKIG